MLGIATTEARNDRKDGATKENSTNNLMSAAPDYSQYRDQLAHMHLAREQEDELLVTIWRMMDSFVNLAFSDDPVQHADAARDRGDLRLAFAPGTHASTDQTLSGAFAFPAAGKEAKERS